ncbi:hypothetical protein HV144_13940 [Citrobacter freundii]|nr:hypothetical protein [Citrobacter freundii]
MKLNSNSGSAGVPPARLRKVVMGWDYVVVLMPTRLQDFAQRENGYVY